MISNDYYIYLKRYFENFVTNDLLVHVYSRGQLIYDVRGKRTLDIFAMFSIIRHEESVSLLVGFEPLNLGDEVYL